MGPYIEIAISLIFIYLIVSFIVTSITEFVAVWLKHRSAMLLKSISMLIDDDNLRKLFYENGFIVSAKRTSADQNIAENAKNHPSYIEGQNFAKALTMAVVKLEDASKLTSAITFDDLKGAVEKLEESRLRDILLAMLSDAQESVTTFETRLAAWYDTAMARLSGEYTRHQKTIALVIGLALAFFLNIDTLRITSELQKNTALRQQIVASAEDYAGSPMQKLCKDKEGSEYTKCVYTEVNELYEEIAPLPIGWKNSVLCTAPTWQSWLSAIIGWLFTGFAVALGAPFWFDTLQKFVNIRGAGKKPPESKATA
ncbi:hypothetical protein [Breoghania sp.]|uniref:hypothetical protein n=1 Tax=Breoghania sp. TaxID=2065378 RepID=UPI002621F214|nr:hypothetical protein [Breoghania sp.]MDJ0931879.1 hypothetical protein [Breoghania sp.]